MHELKSIISFLIPHRQSCYFRPLVRATHRSFKKMDQKDEHFAYAMQLVNATALPMVLHASIQLGVLEVISKEGPDAQLSPSEIASRLGFPNPDAHDMLDRMFRLLASYSVLNCSLISKDQPTRVYGLTPVGKYFVQNQDGVSLGPLLALVQDTVFIDSWYKLKDAVVQGGTPFDMVHGMHAFEYPGKDLRFNDVFNKAMINHTTIVINEIIQSYQGLNNLNRLVDVGGGLGATINLITSKYTTIKGINFDLPHVIRNAPLYPGVEHVGGDMFESVPSGDAIFMKWILHDWSDNHCLKLLKNCYKALPENGKVIVVEAVLPELPDTSSAVKATTEVDAVMMTQNPGGKERTREEFLRLAKGAGFTGIRLECSACNFWVMEFYKKMDDHDLNAYLVPK